MLGKVHFNPAVIGSVANTDGSVRLLHWLLSRGAPVRDAAMMALAAIDYRVLIGRGQWP